MSIPPKGDPSGKELVQRMWTCLFGQLTPLNGDVRWKNRMPPWLQIFKHMEIVFVSPAQERLLCQARRDCPVTDHPSALLDLRILRIQHPLLPSTKTVCWKKLSNNWFT